MSNNLNQSAIEEGEIEVEEQPESRGRNIEEEQKPIKKDVRYLSIVSF